MEYTTFSQVEERLSLLYKEGKYFKITKLIEIALKTLPTEEVEKNLYDLMYYQALFYMKAGKNKEALPILFDMLNKGFFLPLHYKSFEGVSQLDGFSELKDKNESLIEKAKKEVKKEYLIDYPNDFNEAKKYPLFISLHGDSGNINEFRKYWSPEPFLKNGFIHVYIQSLQIVRHQGYGWLKDQLNVRKDIKEYWDLLVNKYPIDKENVYIGGFSGGASAALDVSLSNTIPIKGFICIGPEDKPDFFNKEDVINSVNRKIKGVFMEGEKVLPIKDEEEMVKVFQEVGFPYQFYINKGIGHAIPEDFHDKIERALQFILH